MSSVLKINKMKKWLVEGFKDNNIRTSLFIDPIDEFIEGASELGADRIELYTGPYAHEYDKDQERAIAPYIKAAGLADDLGLGINAGHDLDLNNLGYIIEQIPSIKEVSIGHALICDAIYLGLEKTIQLYLERLNMR